MLHPFQLRHELVRSPSKPSSIVPLNLAALAPALIESELFGQSRGRSTEPSQGPRGWLGRCEHGAVFLDEIGELDPAIQVKLLRVLETRTVSEGRRYETPEFNGKIIAATNRDLAAEMHAGRFRHDLYSGCAPTGRDSSLAEQLADRPEDLPEMVRFIAQEVLPKAAYAAAARHRRVSSAVMTIHGGGRAIDCGSRRLDRARAWPRLRLAGEFPRARPVRPQHHDPGESSPALDSW